MRALADARVLVVVRFAAYAAVVAGAATAPDIPKTVALLGTAHATAHAVPLTDQTTATLGWLSTAIAGVVIRVAGFGGLAFVTALALALTLGLIEWRARRAASPALALAAALLGAACLLDAVHIGDGATNALFFAALLAAFDLRGRRALVCVAAVTVIWCNCSPEGILAPIFAIVFALGPIIERAPTAERKHAQLLALFSLLPIFATPALAAFPGDAWFAVALDNALSDVLPGAPPVAAPVAYYAGMVLTIVAALAIGARGVRAGDTLVFGLAAIFGFAKAELVPLVGIAAAPLLAEAAARQFKQTAPVGGHARALSAQLVVPALCVAIVAGVVAAVRLPTLATATAAAPYGVLARYVREPGHTGRVLCTKLAWCDVAERAYGLDVVADSRIANAPDATIAAQRQIAGAKKGWVHEAHAFDVNAIFVDKRSGFATLLLADGWRPYGVDGTGSLFVRAAATR